VYLYEEEGKTPESFLVAIGRKPWETPTGKFAVNQMIKNPDWMVVDFNNPDKAMKGRVPPGPNNPLGLRWISFASAHGWEVGFHGTAKEQALALKNALRYFPTALHEKLAVELKGRLGRRDHGLPDL